MPGSRVPENVEHRAKKPETLPPDAGQYETKRNGNTKVNGIEHVMHSKLLSYQLFLYQDVHNKCIFIGVAPRPPPAALPSTHITPKISTNYIKKSYQLIHNVKNAAYILMLVLFSMIVVGST